MDLALQDADQLCVLETSRSNARLDFNGVSCLGVVPSKGRRGKALEGSRKNFLKEGQAMNTTWGYCILKAKCKLGWNCDFRDEHPGGWFVEFKDMVLGPSDNL